MSALGSRLVHSLAIVTPTHDVADDVDEYGQPIAGDPTVETVRGLVQPLSAREVAQMNQAGPEIATHRVFLLRRTLSPSAYIRFDPDEGDRYEITGIRDYRSGQSPHLEVEVRRIVSDSLVTSGTAS